jgi:cysteine synthase A
MNHFARAAAASNWRSDDNVAAELIEQLAALGLGAPAWIVRAAGTGGTAATMDRRIRQVPKASNIRLCVVDPEGSAYFKAFASGNADAKGRSTAVVERIGRGRVGPAFLPHVIDHIVAVSNEGPVSHAHWLARGTHRRYGAEHGHQHHRHANPSAGDAVARRDLHDLAARLRRGQALQRHDLPSRLVRGAWRRR